MRALEAAGPRLVRAGKGALLHAKQLRLDQLIGNRRAVDRDEGLVSTATDAVQRLRKTLLANAGLAQQQHRHVAGRCALQQVPCSTEAWRTADQIGRRRARFLQRAQVLDLALQRHDGFDHGIGLVQRQHLLAVFPGLDRLADDAAVRMAAGNALHFAIKDGATHQRRGVAGGIADLHPAGRLVDDAEQLPVYVALERVFPQEFAVVDAGGNIDIDLDRRDADHALDGVQARSDLELAEIALAGAQLLRNFGIAHAGMETHAHEQAARALHAHGVHQFLAQRAKRRGVDQDHALLVEPDRAFLHGKAQAAGKVGQPGAHGGRELVG
ncbi:hypothetical protein D3C81_1186290 [compost metagenome]